jgi:DNA adenine methylase
MKVEQYKNTKVIVVFCAFEVVNKSCKEIVDASSEYAKDFINLCKKYNVKEWVNCGDLLKILPKKVKPFIKWVGGKKKLVDRIMEEFPECIGTYYEPFVGGGSMLFSLNRDCRKSISDINEKLVNCYIVVKNNPEELIHELSNEKYTNDSDNFYRIREVFNSNSEDSIVSAAMFIYLNKCCFNGMYRENKNGHYNVPFGRMKNPIICDAKLIRNVSEYLQNVEIECKSYESIDAKQGDLVYLDPPYHNTFADYNKTGFLEEDHVKLKHFVDQLVSRGVSVVLSNSNTEFITDLYKEYNISIIDTKYSVGATSRSPSQEVLIAKICHLEPAT